VEYRRAIADTATASDAISKNLSLTKEDSISGSVTPTGGRTSIYVFDD
jgi:hypothetical protein